MQATLEAPGVVDLEDGDAIEIKPEEYDIAKFNAVLTLTSPESGEHRTFRVKTCTGGKLKGDRLIELLVGPDNSNDYKAFATVGTETTGWLAPGAVHVWKKYKGTQFEKFVKLLVRPAHYAALGVEYRISTYCRRCNSPLTHPESIDHGFGPVCWKKVISGE
jgi:hypothetical protein